MTLENLLLSMSRDRKFAYECTYVCILSESNGEKEYG